jgi:hypothetical protein
LAPQRCVGVAPDTRWLLSWAAAAAAAGDAPAGSRFTASFGTLQFALDLDPNRLRELLTAWAEGWAGKNWEM